MEENKEEMKWQERSCLKGLICLKLPEYLEKQAEEKESKIFPYLQKPQEIFMDEEGGRIITFNLLDKQLEENQIHAAAGEMQRIINHIYPESIRIHTRYAINTAGVLGWFAFVTGGLTEDHYHIMFLMSLSRQMMLGSYHFPAGQEKEERVNFQGIIQSIQIMEATQEDTGKKYVGYKI